MFQTALIWIFWFSVALGAYVYFIYSLILYITAQIAGRWIRIVPGFSVDDLPHVALLIACYNEEKEIEARLRNVLALDYPKDRLRIIVLNDGSEDATAELTRKFIASHPEAGIELLDFGENVGKSAALFKGINYLKENRPEVKIVAATDANAQWAEDSLRKIIVPFADKKIGSVSGLLRYLDPDNAAVGSMEVLYWKYEAFIKRQASRIGSLPGANGSIFAIRIEAYEPLSEDRGDDFELPVQAIIKGYRSILVEDAESYEAPSRDFTSEYRRKVRITGQMIPSTWMLLGRALSRGRMLIAFQLLSHKLLRYFVPVLQILLLLSTGMLCATGVMYLVVFILQLIFYLFAVIGLIMDRAGRQPPKVFQIPLYFTMVNVASLVSIIRTATGQRVHWERNR